MPIGVGKDGPKSIEEAPSDVGSRQNEADNSDVVIQKFEAAELAAPPCSGCLELNTHVSDINQRDTFAFDVPDVALTRVVWTLLISFNSDQLFVQPFVDEHQGKYTKLDANGFPLRVPVKLEQEFKGKAHAVGLSIGSSGAWTGNRTMAVFVDSVTIEGAGIQKTFDLGDEGFTARTNAHQPKSVHHPAK
jgi:hypothetical protein